MTECKDNFCEIGRSIIATELEGLKHLSEKLDDTFAAACEKIVACRGRLIVTGMGKSGH